MTVECYNNEFLEQGYVSNSAEEDEIFTGIIATDGLRKVKLHHPFYIDLYAGEIMVVKDQRHGKSLKIDASTTSFLTKQRLCQHLRRCFEFDHWQVFSPAGDQITLSYDLSGMSGYTADSINQSFTIIAGGLQQYYSTTLTDGLGRPLQNSFTFLSGNVIKFATNQNSRRVEVSIKKLFIDA